MRARAAYDDRHAVRAAVRLPCPGVVMRKGIGFLCLMHLAACEAKILPNESGQVALTATGQPDCIHEWTFAQPAPEVSPTLPALDSATFDLMWGRPDSELYAERWQKGGVVARRLHTVGRGSHRFVKRASPLDAMEPSLDRVFYGWDAMPYAPLAAGDLNLDGWIDLVVGQMGLGVHVLLNQQGRFIDVTGNLFDEPADAYPEWLGLADVDGDRYLDLLILPAQYRKVRPGALYRFDPSVRRFRPFWSGLGRGKRSAGGISFADLNGDGKLDFYLSFGADWYWEKPDFLACPSQDELWVSRGSGWQEELARWFPELARRSYVGMTALFADADGNGWVDFFLGNDMLDPSFTYFQQPSREFRLVGRDVIEANTLNSMSYFPADFDNDGVMEFWENGIADRFPIREREPSLLLRRRDRDGRAQQMRRLHEQFRRVEQHSGRTNKPVVFDCADFADFYVRSLCEDHRANQRASETGDRNRCAEIRAVATRQLCLRNAMLYGTGGMGSSMFAALQAEGRNDTRRFPRQIRPNVLLQRDASGRYRDILAEQSPARYTGWSWAAYPFDADNDGSVDLLVGTGYALHAHELDRLLLNRSRRGVLDFQDASAAWGIDREEDTRGMVAADWDGDGDLDLALNGFMSTPTVLENRAGGASIQIELRSKRSNYYAIGASIELRTANMRQVRVVAIGGIWNTSQPLLQHFGVPPVSKSFVKVLWPNGQISEHGPLAPGFRYVIYED